MGIGRRGRRGRRSGRAEERSRRHRQFGRAELALVEKLLRKEWSPEQVSGYLRRRGELLISHETIYRQVSCGSVRA